MSRHQDDVELRSLLIAADRRAPDPEVRVVVDARRFERISRLRLMRRAAVLGLLVAALSTWNLMGRQEAGRLVAELPRVGVVETTLPGDVPHPDDVLSRVRLERAAMTALVSARRASGERRVQELRSVVQLFEGTEAAEWAAWSLRFLSSEEK